jgi:hypothetical protein
LSGFSAFQYLLEELDKLLESNRELTSCIVDALSNLNLSRPLVQRVCSSLLKKLDSPNLEDLPLAINFIFAYIDPQSLAQVEKPLMIESPDSPRLVVKSEML